MADDSLFQDSLVSRSWLDRLTGRAVPDPAPGLASAFLGGGLAVLAVSTVVGIVGAAGVDVEAARAAGLSLTLGTVTAVTAGVLFAVAAIRWTLNGERAVLWAGVGALVYGVVAVAIPRVVGPIWDGEPGPVLPSVSAAGQVTAFLVLASGAIATLVGFRATLSGIMGAAAATAAALTFLFHVLPDLAASLAVDRFGSSPPAIAVIVVIGLWLVLGAAYLIWGIRHRWLYGWCGLLVFSLTLAHLAEAVAEGITDPWWVGGAALAATGMSAAATVSAIEMAKVSGDKGERLFRSEVVLKAVEARDEAVAVDERDRRHDVANALLSIEGAAAIIERHAGQLDEDVPFRGALKAGIEHLRSLIDPAPRTGAWGAVNVVAVAAQAIGELGWAERVTLEASGPVIGAGSRDHLSEVVRLLLVNADERSPRTSIAVRATDEEGWAVLWVDDGGPALSGEERRWIAGSGTLPGHVGHVGRLGRNGRPVERGAADVGARPAGARGEAASTGVTLAARLVRSQGGDLWAEPREGGGATFAVCLPVPAPVAAQGPGEPPA